MSTTDDDIKIPEIAYNIPANSEKKKSFVFGKKMKFRTEIKNNNSGEIKSNKNVKILFGIAKNGKNSDAKNASISSAIVTAPKTLRLKMSSKSMLL